jgi:hypothetical protein
MNNQPTTTTPRTRDTDGDADSNRLCQADRCSLPPSLLPWTFQHGSVTFLLWLCHGHGHMLTGEQPSVDEGGEAA